MARIRCTGFERSIVVDLTCINLYNARKVVWRVATASCNPSIHHDCGGVLFEDLERHVDYYYDGQK